MFLRNKRGLSLLEVILSIAILGAAMVVITQLFNLGYRSARQATLRNEASILCDAKMAELAAGVIPLQSSGESIVDEAPDWRYSVSIADGAQPGLLVGTVTVTRIDMNRQPLSMSVVRFLPDPDYEPDAGALQ